MTDRERIIEAARLELGTKEDPANSNLQKYGKWYGMDAVAWCAIFVSWLYNKAGVRVGRITSTATGLTLSGVHDTLVLTASGQTATLPTAVGILGRVYSVKLTASGTGTVATTSSQTIDGSTTYSLSAQYKYVTVQSDGSNWVIIGQN